MELFVRKCKRCGERVDKNLECSFCKKLQPPYLFFVIRNILTVVGTIFIVSFMIFEYINMQTQTFELKNTQIDGYYKWRKDFFTDRIYVDFDLKKTTNDKILDLVISCNYMDSDRNILKKERDLILNVDLVNKTEFKKNRVFIGRRAGNKTEYLECKIIK